jgi:hypothetical protein
MTIVRWLNGKLFAEKGGFSQKLFDSLVENEIHLVT